MVIKKAALNKGKKGWFLNFSLESEEFNLAGAFLYTQKGRPGRLIKLVGKFKNGKACRELESQLQEMVKGTK